MLVIFKDQFYPLTIHAEGYELVWTMLGIFKTLVLEPRMEETPPVGMFKHGSTVKVWIATWTTTATFRSASRSVSGSAPGREPDRLHPAKIALPRTLQNGLFSGFIQ